MDDSRSTRPVHNIGVVQRRTGIKADLVRAWERRYGAIVPARTATQRRLYSDADLRRLELLRDATRRGHRISHIASLPDEELLGLLQPPSDRLDPETRPRSRPELESLLGACLSAVENLDSSRLTSELEKASLDLGRIALVEDLLVPLLDRVGARWRHGEMDPAQEHLASATIRSFVSGFLASPSSPYGPRLVVTTPAGQRHELGAMLAAAMAAAEGWRVTYLGPDLPADSIAAAVRRAGASVVALGITFSDVQPSVVEEVESLSARLGDVRLIAGGQGVAALEPIAERLGVTVVRSLSDFRAALAGSAGGEADSGAEGGAA